MADIPEYGGYGRQKLYKVKLTSGRILGPFGVERIRLLILKNQILGSETAREYPRGEWQDINQLPEIADLFLANVQGLLKKKSQSESQNSEPEEVNPFGETVVLPAKSNILPGAEKPSETLALAPLPELDLTQVKSSGLFDDTQPKIISSPSEGALTEKSPPKLPSEFGASESIINLEVAPISDPQSVDEDKTRVVSEEELQEKIEDPPVQEDATDEFSGEEMGIQPSTVNVANERTIVFQRSTNDVKVPGKKHLTKREIIQKIVLGLVLGVLGYQTIFPEAEDNSQVRIANIRPKLPTYIEGRSDPKKSEELYNEALKFYVADTVVGYKLAADKFREAASHDINNVKALAMLASSYINLIDSSNKDENYFTVLSKLIEMSRAKAVDVPETVIADVEFYLVINKAEAAQNKIVDYSKTHPSNFDLSMFYYLALTFFERGDANQAAQFLTKFPDNKIYSAKVFFLRGKVAEKLNDLDSAMSEYEKGFRFNPEHAKSRLKVASLMAQKGQLKESGRHLEYLVTHTNLLAPRDRGQAFFLHAQLSELYEKWDLALGDVERASKLDPENPDYLLELYTLRAKAGDSLKTVQKQARMYYFLGEGEKLVKLGRYQDALIQFLQARQANDSSPIPLIKMGDMFSYLHDVENARLNYKLATERAKNDIHVWSKYIKTLIQSFEWAEASKAMDRFRQISKSESSIDKAAADMYQRQGRFVEAQTFYRKAMSRDVIDPEVYTEYAKSLMSTKNYKDAPFFFALALRFDPLNVEAIINTAKCVAETESIDRAINMLQDELKQGSKARAEFLAAVAELQIQKGSWLQAAENVEQSMQADPDYAYAWKIRAQIAMNQENTNKDAINKALLDYESFSKRNPSDPSGYLERYKLLMKKTEFEKAKEELARIYAIYPKYPNLHFYYGTLYSVQGNHKEAAAEFKLELSNNPNVPRTMIALGKELLELNFTQEALTQFTEAMRMEPRNAEAKQNAGWANYRLRNFQAGVTLIQAALLIDKANPLLFRRLGIVQRDMGDLPGACQSFNHYIEMEPDAPDKSEFAACLH